MIAEKTLLAASELDSARWAKFHYAVSSLAGRRPAREVAG